MLPLDEAIGRRERSELGNRLNVLVTDAGAKAWFIGEPPDFDRWFRRSEGRTPVCVVDLRSIPSEQGKQIFVEYLLQELFYWLTRQEGTQTLQYLLISMRYTGTVRQSGSPLPRKFSCTSFTCPEPMASELSWQPRIRQMLITK